MELRRRVCYIGIISCVSRINMYMHANILAFGFSFVKEQSLLRILFIFINVIFHLASFIVIGNLKVIRFESTKRSFSELFDLAISILFCCCIV